MQEGRPRINRYHFAAIICDRSILCIATCSFQRDPSRPLVQVLFQSALCLVGVDREEGVQVLECKV